MLIFPYGRFHWAACCLEVLRKSKGSNEIKKTSENLPSNVFKIYDSILSTIPEAYVASAKKAFQWLAFLERPLYIE